MDSLVLYKDEKDLILPCLERKLLWPKSKEGPANWKKWATKPIMEK
jgi:hypothetical protein